MADSPTLRVRVETEPSPGADAAPAQKAEVAEGAVQPEETPLKQAASEVSALERQSALAQHVLLRPWTCAGALAGLVLAVLVLTLGVGRTCFVAAMVALGALCGAYADGRLDLAKLGQGLGGQDRG